MVGFLGSLVAQLVKNRPAMLETWVRSLGWEDALEKGKATLCLVNQVQFTRLPCNSFCTLSFLGNAGRQSKRSLLLERLPNLEYL